MSPFGDLGRAHKLQNLSESSHGSVAIGVGGIRRVVSTLYCASALLHCAETMAYTVLARRYRSGTFDEVIGQDHVAQDAEKGD